MRPLRAFPDGVVNLSDVMEDANGEPSIVLQLRLEKRGERMMLDYTGTRRNCRCRSTRLRRHAFGVYYAIRALLAPDSDDDGVFRPSRCTCRGTLLNPHRRPVSAATSRHRCVTRSRARALGMLAPERVPAQRRSMNNVMMGGIDERASLGIYKQRLRHGRASEATASMHPSAYDQHAQQPIEVLERTFPLRVTLQFADATAGAAATARSGLVRAAGAAGTATISLLGERHAVRPHGSAGGSAVHGAAYARCRGR